MRNRFMVYMYSGSETKGKRTIKNRWTHVIYADKTVLKSSFPFTDSFCYAHHYGVCYLDKLFRISFTSASQIEIYFSNVVSWVFLGAEEMALVRHLYDYLSTTIVLGLMKQSRKVDYFDPVRYPKYSKSDDLFARINILCLLISSVSICSGHPQF